MGGTLIRRFDGFRRLCGHAAEQYRLPLQVTEEDMLAANRTLAALGGPPATPEVRGRFTGDGLPLLLLFLLTQEIPCQIGLFGQTDGLVGDVRRLIHLIGQGVSPILAGGNALPFQDTVRELNTSTIALRPCIRYASDGEPSGIEPIGAAGVLHVGAESGPCTLAVLCGPGVGPAPLDSPRHLHPAVLIVTV